MDTLKRKPLFSEITFHVYQQWADFILFLCRNGVQFRAECGNEATDKMFVIKIPVRS